MRRLTHSSAFSNILLTCGLVAAASSAVAQAPESDFPDIPLPPPIEGLIGMPQAYVAGRKVHLDVIKREADKAGLPPDIADAVAQIESAYNPGAVGGVGEVGLMQIRPTTAAMLGYKGTVTGLFEPETNIRYGVRYLARAWRLADGNLCRALMKYRAGHGEERMTALSMEYCRRVRMHLASVGSPFGADADADPVGGATPASSGPPKAATGASAGAAAGRETGSLAKAELRALIAILQVLPPRRPSMLAGAIQVLPPRRPSNLTGIADALPPRRPSTLADTIRILPPRRPPKGLTTAAADFSEGPGTRSAPVQEKTSARKAKARQIRISGEARIRSISARIRPESLRISTGI